MSEPSLHPLIRPETTQDIQAIRNVLVQAFRTDAEANLVELLRERHQMTLSLVAEVEGQIAGHILYSPVTIETNRMDKLVLGLAPLAVLPAWQHLGIGGALIRASFEVCRSQAVDGAVVLGSPRYYPRFGFSPANAYGLTCEYPVLPEEFMAAAFAPSGLEGCAGVVHYAPAFTELGV